MIDRFERFLFSISEINRCWHKIAAEEMEKYGLKGAHVVYLVTMYRYPDGITATQLSELCSRDKSDVSRTMTTMENRGLVKREGVNQNLYRALLKLTDEGKTAAEHVRERARIAVEIAGAGLTDEQRRIFYDSLELITSNLKNICEEGLPQS